MRAPELYMAGWTPAGTACSLKAAKKDREARFQRPPRAWDGDERRWCGPEPATGFLRAVNHDEEIVMPWAYTSCLAAPIVLHARAC